MQVSQLVHYVYHLLKFRNLAQQNFILQQHSIKRALQNDVPAAAGH